MKILVVDDESSYRMLLEDFLRKEGWTVFTAENGEEALKLLGQVRINVIISDVYMPVMDGMKFFKATRALAGYEATPFLLVSAIDDDQTRAAVQLSKNSGFMKKLSPMSELKAWIAYLLLPKDKRPSLPPGAEPSRTFSRNVSRESRISRH